MRDGEKDGEEPWEKGKRGKGTPEGSGGLRRCCRGEGEGGLNLSSQLDRNHSLQQHPAETFDMEIHDRVNIWT